MQYKAHRENLYSSLETGSILLLFSGVEQHTNEDHYHDFEVNSQFFYLTGMDRPNQCLMAVKTANETREILFIEEADPLQERWTGKMPTPDEARECSGVQEIQFLPALSGLISRYMSRSRINFAYFDLYRNGESDLPDYNALRCEDFRKKYPWVQLKDLHALCAPLREVKDVDEVERVRKAIDWTRQGLECVMKQLKPGMMEYQAQALFEYTCRSLGAEKMAFNTIAGSGLNGCMMHYETNRDQTKDGDLLLLDLGAKYGNYCSDITRTYPVNGKFSPRQRQIYDLVLKANRAVAEKARPGMTLRELNDVAKDVLGEGLVEIGLIEKKEDVGKYYMHSVSHSIGIDVHDICYTGDVLQPGWIISDEPGLYIDEEKIGIRIEDDLLITEDGCEVLSESILRDPDEIEAFMADR